MLPATVPGCKPRPLPPCPRPASARRVEWRSLPLVLAALLYLGASCGPGVVRSERGAVRRGRARDARTARRIISPATRARLERGRWYVPTNDGIPRLQKPPLVYWALMASMRVFGVNEFGARLPNAVSCRCCGLRRRSCWGGAIGGPALGLAAATILATMAGTFIFCHLIAPEPFLAAALTLTFWCFLAAVPGTGSARGGGCLWPGCSWRLGTACKGLHGALYPLACRGDCWHGGIRRRGPCGKNCFNPPDR